jgi:hypothetical protein
MDITPFDDTESLGNAVLKAWWNGDISVNAARQALGLVPIDDPAANAAYRPNPLSGLSIGFDPIWNRVPVEGCVCPGCEEARESDGILTDADLEAERPELAQQRAMRQDASVVRAGYDPEANRARPDPTAILDDDDDQEDDYATGGILAGTYPNWCRPEPIRGQTLLLVIFDEVQVVES